MTALLSPAAELDHRLGDPRDPANPHGFAAAVRRDALSGRPEALIEACRGLALSFVPAAEGGTLSTMDETLALVRMAARRDVTVMPHTMFSITAATCVLLAGTPDQRRRVVELLAQGHAIGFALSEPEHGSDLLANGCLLEPHPDGFLLTGDKWMVGLGERARALVLVGRTGGRGAGAFTAVLLDDVDRARAGNAVTSGMKGVDFTAFAFAGEVVPADAVVGQTGHGLEIAMKAMQVVRTMSTGANLAAADTGLRVTLDFAVRHVVAGRPVVEHERNRRELGTAAAALLACDVVATACARGMHTNPAGQSLWSSVAKKVCTDLSEEVFRRCTDVLGTRALLADSPFDVMRRDNAVVRHIDTGPTANLRLVAAHLAGRATDTTPPETAFTLDRPLPPLDLHGLGLSTRGRDEVTQSLPEVAAAMRTVLADDRALDLLHRLEKALTDQSGDPLDRAERFCFLHAAAACAHLWWFNLDRSLFGTPPGDTGWLVATLALLLDRAHRVEDRLRTEDANPVLDAVLALHATGRLFSATPLPLAEGGTPA
ncbi:acyl-CoA dehydrogenase family protein [Saccharothrix variisporea]|uniref:Alkylation response protein AidB-like acyl-CoA dehydrogenase n=1 Tax=Saccharothrix variisporea TaxID=543527 RepID=A0A495XJA4_9PSEU|nr:acyl-CoA dehydrogenase family protein [Saccharothrix variisporea]RKT74167.1 alkylation response protein AidB-like acyl-CoA dehydrogenase [Saccharothrix variisporea]